MDKSFSSLRLLCRISSTDSSSGASSAGYEKNAWHHVMPAPAPAQQLLRGAELLVNK
jgi:hypothetical protein